ncbi:carboxypeptidase regulatory-like domain-containing protein [Symbioplanes lichenis]|uniref:carboxypeptidase regulatory-like domain-containing protein n=1 Tax=Symbioplanes lichenis TaxID=1629072 RepID=UPI0027389230|nr:carboxypeptidase regulatory-like domain-containing protein [Actinoplanes lichenis]
MRARIAATLVAVVTAAGLQVLTMPGAAVAAPAPATGCVPEQADAAAAQRMAGICGKRVEILAERTEYAQVFLNPGGTRTLEQSIEPARVRRGDSWVPVDTDLRRTREGVVPRATVLPMTFSAGGDNLVGRLRDGGRELAVTWPGTLPEPRLDGPTATYPEVLPGVDLRVTATATGFSEILVVRDRAAAANPDLAAVRFGMSAKGVRMSAAPGGGLVARDSKGAPVFQAPAPLMWDSSATPESAGAGPAETTAAEGSGAARERGGSAGTVPGGGERVRRAAMPVKVESDALTITPHHGMLTDPRTQFPVYIDPSVTGGLVSNEWTSVWSKYPTQSFWKNSDALTDGKVFGAAGAGRTEDCAGCADHIIRSLFRMDTSKVKKTKIESAEFRIEQRHAWTCNPVSNAKLWMTGNFSAATTWKKQPTWYSKSTAQTKGNHKNGGVHGCLGTGTIEFNVTSIVDQAAKGGWNSVSVGLRAIDEGTKTQWKRFNPTTAKLAITYDRAPNAATDRKSDGKACVVGSKRPYVLWTNPTLSAKQSDPDGDQDLTTDFYWWVKGGTRSESNKVSQANGNNAIVSKQIPAGRLTDGATYVWQAKTTDGGNLSTWSGTCEFTVDATPPPQPGAITSTDYSNTTPKGGVGLPGSFAIAPPTVRPYEVVAYAWTLDSGKQIASQIVKADATTYAGSVTLKPVHDGINTLRVWSKDHAGRFSLNPATFTFQVRAGSGPAAEWTFDETEGDATDISGHGNTAVLGNSVSRVAGRGNDGSALALTGIAPSSATAAAVTYPHPDTGVKTAMRTDQNFTVAARVKLPSTSFTNQRVVVAASGTRASAYTLGYSATDNRWRFTMAGSDVDNPALFSVLSNAAPATNKWTHLAGVYNSATKKLTLYVNGVAQTATATLTGGFHATGAVTIGKRKWNGADDGYLTGEVDDVRVYSFAETAANLALLALPLQPTLSLPAGEDAKYGGTVPVTFDAGGDSNVTKFRYSVGDTTLGTTVNAAGAGGTVTVNVPVGTVSGQRPVHAVAVDDGNRVSPLTQILVKVGPPEALDGTVLDMVTWLPVSGAVVTLQPGGRQVTTDADGAYAFDDLAVGTYSVKATSGGRCGVAGSQSYEVDGQGLTLDLYLMRASDVLGHTCSERAVTFEAGTTLLPLTGDNAVTTVDLPFAFPFYGSSYRSAWVDTNGLLSFTDPEGSRPYDGTSDLINAAAPNGVIAPFWDDLVVDASAGVRTSITGSGSDQRFLIEWRNVSRKANSAQRISFELSLAADGTVTANYSSLDNAAEQGSGALVGLESPEGDDGLSYSTREAALASGRAVVFTRPDMSGGFETYNLTGTLTDSAGAPAAGVPVSLDPGGLVATTAANGVYSFYGVEADSYSVVARKPGQKCGTAAEAVVDLGENTTRDLRLGTDYGDIGYACATGTASWVAASTVVPLTGNGVRAPVTLPFPVRLHGPAATTASVSEDGYLVFGSSYLVPFFTDFTVDGSASVRTQAGGTAPNRTFVVEWRNVLFTGTTERVSFEVVLHEDGRFVYQYAIGGTTDRQKGSTATASLQAPNGITRFYSGREALLTPGSSLTWTPAAPGAVTGVLTEAETTEPVAGATVTLTPGNLSVTTADDGSFRFDGVTVGQYTLQVTGGNNRCWGSYAATTIVKAYLDEKADLSALAPRDFYYDCATARQAFTPAADVQPDWTGDEQTWRSAIPFPVKLYGESYNVAYVSDNGVLTFQPPGDPISGTDRAGAIVRSSVKVFYDDWVVDSQAAVATGVTGTAPDRRWTVEWRNVQAAGDPATRVSFEAIFEETGGITLNYAGINPASPREQGRSGVVSVTDDTGDYDFAYLDDGEILADDLSVRLVPAAERNTVTGTVTCSGAPVAEAVVTVAGRSGTTGTDGAYQVDEVPAKTLAAVATLPAGACAGSHVLTGLLGRDPQVIDFATGPTPPGAGHKFAEAEVPYVPLGDADVLPMDDWYEVVDLPFPVTLQGRTRSQVQIEDDGALYFGAEDGSPLWLDVLWSYWDRDEQSDVRVATRGTAPNRQYVVEWRNVGYAYDPEVRATFQVTLDEGGGIRFAYPDNDGTYFMIGGDAIIGIEDWTDAEVLFADHEPTMRPGLGMRIDPPIA